jgi:hypothetical protein
MTTQFMNDNVELSEAISYLSDSYKEAHGFRPCTARYEVMSLEKIQDVIDDLNAVIFDNMEIEYFQEEISDYTFQGLVKKTISLGAGDEITALKWLFDAYLESKNIAQSEVDFFELEHFVWNHGIMHTAYGKRILSIIKEPYMNYEA